MRWSSVPAILLAAMLVIPGACGQRPTSQAVPCDSDPARPSVQIVSTTTQEIVAQGQIMAFTADSKPVDVAFQWDLTGQGSLKNAAKPTVQYMAPPSVSVEEEVIITVTVTDKTGCKAKAKDPIKIRLLPVPTPAPEPMTASPARQPAELVTDAPIAAGITGPTSSTPAVAPLQEIFPLVGDGEDFAWRDKGGQLVNQIVDAEECRHSGVYGLRLTYAMAGDGTGGWGVHWDKAPQGHLDASGFSALVFWVKGTTGGETFGIGLKDTSGKEAYVKSQDLVVVSDSSWKMASVPLSKFAEVNISFVNNINFAFNQAHGSGSICIDDIAFVKVVSPGSSTMLTFTSGMPGTPAETGRQTVSIRVDQPGQYAIVLENANPPWSEHWLRWDYLALKQGDTVIWEIGEDEAPPSYSFEAASELCDPRRSSDCTTMFVAESSSASAFFFDLNDGDRTRATISFTLAKQQTNADLTLVLSTLESTHPGAADFKMKVALQTVSQP